MEKMIWRDEKNREIFDLFDLLARMIACQCAARLNIAK